jgi:adhesin transport system outer membrane protein
VNISRLIPKIALCVLTLWVGTVKPSRAQETPFEISNDRTIEELSVRAEEMESLEKFKEIATVANVVVSKEKTSLLIQEIERFNPSIAEANFNLAATRHDVTAAMGAKLPQVTLTGLSLYSDGDMNSASKAAGKPAVALSAQYALYDWGRLDANILVRKELEQASLLRREVIRRQLTAEALSICLELSKQVTIVRANNEYFENLADLKKKIASIVQEDAGRASELLQVESRILQAQLQQMQVNSKVEELALRLQKIIGPGRVNLCKGIGASLIDIATPQDIEDGVSIHPQVEIQKTEYRQAEAAAAQITATRKPQVSVRLDHTPLNPGVGSAYGQSVTIAATVPLYDGNTLRSSERAALERLSAAQERILTSTFQLRADFKERTKLATTNLLRAEDYVALLKVNAQVRSDFYIQWGALGRRSLFELLAIQQEQLSLRTAYFTTLYDAMIAIAIVKAGLGVLPTVDKL